MSSGYQNWIPGQPDNFGSDEYCVIMTTKRGGRWNDVSCDEKGYVYCEKCLTCDDLTEQITTSTRLTITKTKTSTTTLTTTSTETTTTKTTKTTTSISTTTTASCPTGWSGPTCNLGRIFNELVECFSKTDFTDCYSFNLTD